MSDARPMEELLKLALTPIEPSATLAERLDERLTALTASAFDELAGWEVEAMRDPRNWVRPAAAVVAGSAAGAALVLLRARHRAAQRRRPSGVVDAAERALREVFTEARRLAR